MKSIGGTMAETITRKELVRIVDESSRGVTASTRARLLAVAETTDAVAAGWFHCDGVQCPASQAGRRNQQFQEAYDYAMALRFDVAPEDMSIEPFVVRVSDASRKEQES